MTVRSASQAVRVSSASYHRLKELAAGEGKPLVACLDDLVHEAYQRRIWARFAEANRRLQADGDELAAHRAEEALWSAADADGLAPDDGVEWDEELEDAASW